MGCSMCNKLLMLNALLMENNDFSLDELKELLYMNDNELVKELLNNLSDKIKNLDINDSLENYKYLEKTFDHVNNIIPNNKYNLENITKIISECKKSLKEKKKQINMDKKKYIKWELFIVDLINKVKSIELNLLCNDENKNNKYKYWFIFYLISDISNYQLIKDIFSECPRFINLRDQNRKHIFTYIVNNYIETIKSNYNDKELANELVYFENIIDIFINNNNFNLKEEEAKEIIKIINGANNTISLLKINHNNKKIVVDRLHKLKSNLSTRKKEEDFKKKIESLKIRYNISLDFNNFVIPRTILSNDEKRLDLSNELIFTIDGFESKDLDDALSIKMLNNGNYLLGVHITDVSNYIERDSSLEEEAYLRGNTIYLSNAIIPMIPPELSNGICSLLPNQKKLAISYLIEITKNGEIVNSSFNRSIVCSAYKLTHENVKNIIDLGDANSKLEVSLNRMMELSYILKSNNEHKTSYRSLKETIKGIINEKISDDIKHPCKKYIGEQIVEEFMTLSNYLVANHFYKEDLPFLYRTHDKIDIYNLIDEVKIMGNNVFKENNLDFEYDKFLKMVLNAYPDAKYDKKNTGHYGLGLKTYSHSTSPIRRYSDFIVQRLLEDFVFNTNNKNHYIDYWDENLDMIARHLNNKQILNREFSAQYEKIMSKTKRI
jgi:hypothetical protein